jgi:hypothetical protein
MKNKISRKNGWDEWMVGLENLNPEKYKTPTDCVMNKIQAENDARAYLKMKGYNTTGIYFADLCLIILKESRIRRPPGIDNRQYIVMLRDLGVFKI